MTFGLTPDRHNEIMAELKRAKAYFERIRAEIQAVSARPDVYQAEQAKDVVEAIQNLEWALERSQEHQRISAEIDQRLYGGDRE